jgi:hypothetical protein
MIVAGLGYKAGPVGSVELPTEPEDTTADGEVAVRFCVPLAWKVAPAFPDRNKVCLEKGLCQNKSKYYE